MQTLSVVYCALVRCLLSWKWESDSTRVQLLAGLIETMTPTGGQAQLQDLSHITAVLLHAKPDTSSAKKLLFTAVQVKTVIIVLFLKLIKEWTFFVFFST